MNSFIYGPLLAMHRNPLLNVFLATSLSSNIFATVSQYCRSNVKFIDITLSLITISLFIF